MAEALQLLKILLAALLGSVFYKRNPFRVPYSRFWIWSSGEGNQAFRFREYVCQTNAVGHPDVIASRLLVIRCPQTGQLLSALMV